MRGKELHLVRVDALQRRLRLGLDRTCKSEVQDGWAADVRTMVPRRMLLRAKSDSLPAAWRWGGLC
jgi:hypothetical protein